MYVSFDFIVYALWTWQLPLLINGRLLAGTCKAKRRPSISYVRCRLHLDFPLFKLGIVGGPPFSHGGDQLFRKSCLSRGMDLMIWMPVLGVFVKLHMEQRKIMWLSFFRITDQQVLFLKKMIYVEETGRMKPWWSRSRAGITPVEGDNKVVGSFSCFWTHA